MIGQEALRHLAVYCISEAVCGRQREDNFRIWSCGAAMAGLDFLSSVIQDLLGNMVQGEFDRLSSFFLDDGRSKDIALDSVPADVFHIAPTKTRITTKDEGVPDFMILHRLLDETQVFIRFQKFLQFFTGIGL